MITWKNEKRKLSQLIPWPRNPRQIKGAEVKRLQESLEEFGQVEVTAIGPNNELYNGHQRLKSWMAKFGDFEIDVRVSSRPLTEKEREKLTVFLHKGAAGEWDFDTLSEWDTEDLLQWGFSEGDLGLIGDIPTLEELETEHGEPRERDFWPYVRVQVSPETMTKYKALMETLPGADEAEKFDALVSGGC